MREFEKCIVKILDKYISCLNPTLSPGGPAGTLGMVDYLAWKRKQAKTMVNYKEDQGAGRSV